MGRLDSLGDRLKGTGSFFFNLLIGASFPIIFAYVGGAIGLLISLSPLTQTIFAGALYYLGIDLPTNRIIDFLFVIGFLMGFIGGIFYPILKVASSRPLNELNEIMGLIEEILPRLKEHDDKISLLQKGAPLTTDEDLEELEPETPESDIIEIPVEAEKALPKPKKPVLTGLKTFDSKTITDEIENKLVKADIFDVEDLANTDLETLRNIVGKRAVYLSNKAKEAIAKTRPKVKGLEKPDLSDEEELTALIPVITPEIEADLANIGIFTIGDLSKSSPDDLLSVFGNDEKKTSYVINKATELAA